MLTEICGEIHNYFVREKYHGSFKISGGAMQPLDFLQDGQYYCIVGSVFNDGVHRYPEKDLDDETFTGEIWAMAVPKRLLDLIPEIQKFKEDVKNATEKDGWDILQSQSFGGFSASVKSQNDLTWQKKFATQLNEWRKLP